MKINRGICFLIVIFFLLGLSVDAQEKKGDGKSEGKKPQIERGFGFTASRAPIDITSDTVEGDQKQNRVTFKGNVIAKQEEATLYANTLVIFYDQDSKKLKEIVATGNVKITQLERRATSQKAVFDQEKNIVILDGDVVIREEANVIRGEKVTFYIDEERSVVEGGKGGRVSTSITPPPKEKEEEKKPKGEKKK